MWAGICCIWHKIFYSKELKSPLIFLMKFQPFSCNPCFLGSHSSKRVTLLWKGHNTSNKMGLLWLSLTYWISPILFLLTLHLPISFFINTTFMAPMWNTSLLLPEVGRLSDYWRCGPLSLCLHLACTIFSPWH